MLLDKITSYAYFQSLIFGVMMDLVCEKYRETIAAEGAFCRHANEYCKFRSSCIIQFVSKEKSREKNMVALRFEKGNGMVPAIVQDHESGDVLMLAYINDEAWQKTIETGKAHFFSRSRNRIWLKGETSGHQQLIKEILVDCDEDTVIFKVEQLGKAACHKGYRSCFFRKLEGDSLVVTDKPVFDPQEVYKK